MTDRKTMIEEANDLGLQFPGNISNVNLAGLIANEKGEPVPVIETAPPGPAVKAEEPTEKSDEQVIKSAGRSLAQIRAGVRRKQIAAAKKAATKKHIVTITNKDPRENDKVTTAYLAFENQHFGVARSVPLDIAVELEEALIKIAASCTMILHKDEIIDGRRTGNKVTVKVKKYAISYSNKRPE